MLKMFLFLLLICACSSAVHVSFTIELFNKKLINKKNLFNKLNTEPHSRIDAVKVETKTTPDNLEVPKKLYLDTEATELSQESGMTLAEAKALIKFRDRDVSSGSTITAIVSADVLFFLFLFEF